MEGKFIVASGPVIIKKGCILVDKDSKDDFYKIPGGTVREGESLEDACIRRAKQEINADIKIVKAMKPKILYENPQTKEKMVIVLINYLAKLVNPKEIRAIEPVKELRWLSIKEIRQGKHRISPNVEFIVSQISN